jgi:hypothetical protein
VGIADGDPLSIALGIALGDEDDGSSILRGLLEMVVAEMTTSHTL